MTKIQELEQKLNEWLKTVSKEEMIKILKEEGFEVIDKESKKEGKWKPKAWEDYWFKETSGSVGVSTWEGDRIDIGRYNNIPIFPTKEECERYWHFMDTVKEKSYEFSTDEWRNVNITKWRMGYSFQDGKWEIVPLGGYYIPGAFFFKNSSDAQYMIDNFKDELMEFWI